MWSHKFVSGDLDEWTASTQCCLCMGNGVLSHLSHSLQQQLPEPSAQTHLSQNHQPTCISREWLGRDHCVGNTQAGHRGCVMCCSQLRWTVLLNLKKSEGLQRLPGWSVISTCTNTSHPVRCMCTFVCKMLWKMNKDTVCAVPAIPSSMCALLFP